MRRRVVCHPTLAIATSLQVHHNCMWLNRSAAVTRRKSGTVQAVFLLLAVFVVALAAEDCLNPLTNGAARYLEVDFKTLAHIQLDQTGATSTKELPEFVRHLDGRRVRIAGLMWAPYVDPHSLHLKEFQLTLPRGGSWGPPLAQEFLNCKPLPGGDVDWTDGAVEVLGVLHVRILRDGGKVISVYRMDVEKVEPAPPAVAAALGVYPAQRPSSPAAGPVAIPIARAIAVFTVLAAAISGLVVLITHPARRRRHRRQRGLCTHCGYDLRHSADRCPECGQLRHDYELSFEVA
jgi:hypothetical protein